MIWLEILYMMDVKSYGVDDEMFHTASVTDEEWNGPGKEKDFHQSVSPCNSRLCRVQYFDSA